MKNPSQISLQELFEQLGCGNPQVGLSPSSVSSLQRVHGSNAFEPEEKVILIITEFLYYTKIFIF